MAIVDNLVSYWKLEESSGNARIDSHGSNDLTDNNTVGQATGKIGEGADFESGNSEYLNITNAAQTGLDFTSDFSFNSWIKPESAHIGTLCSKNGSYGNFGFTFQIRSGGELRVILSSNGTSETIKTTTAAPITTGVFQMVTAVYDASAGSVTFYYNGTSLEIETGYPTSFNNSSDDFRLGKLSSGGAAYFDGIMDEVRISNVARSADWIKTEYYNQNSPSTFYGVGSEEKG